MTKQQLYDSIEQYLEGNLSKTETAEFEKQLQNDPNLSAEVSLHRKVEEELGDATKKELRSILSEMKGKYSGKEEGKVVQMQPRQNIRRMLAIAASVLILGMAFWYLFFRNPADEPQFADDELPNQEEVIPNEETPKDNPDKVIENDPSNLAEDKTKNSQQPSQDDPSNTPEDPGDQPAIDFFEDHPGFEELLANSNQDAFEFEMEAPLANAVLTSRNGSVPFRMLATLRTGAFPENDQFVLRIFNNQEESFTGKQTVFETPLSFEKDEEQGNFAFGEKEVYYLEFQQNLELAPGLYYWFVGLGDKNVIGGKIYLDKN